MRRECHLIVNCLSGVCHALLSAVRDAVSAAVELRMSREDERGHVVVGRLGVHKLLHEIKDGRA